MKRKILTRGLPKTGQITSYRTGDDGDLEIGWWKGSTAANNRTRFIAKTIGGDDVVIDLATGLMWAADGNGAGGNNGTLALWNGGIDYCLGLTFAGYSDWRLPNIKEHFSIVEYDKALRDAAEPLINPLFDNIGRVEPYWTSTTVVYDTTKAHSMGFSIGIIYAEDKATYFNRLLSVRGGL